MAELSRACRVSIHAACAMLTSFGYTPERISGKTRWFDIIAWKQEKILGIVVRTTRSEGINHFPSLVQKLSEIVRRRLFPGEIQVWISQSHEWHRYSVLPGGAISITGRFA